MSRVSIGVSAKLTENDINQKKGLYNKVKHKNTIENMIRMLINQDIDIKKSIAQDYSDDKVLIIVQEKVRQMKEKEFQNAKENEDYERILEFIAPNVNCQKRKNLYPDEISMRKAFDEKIINFSTFFCNYIDNLRISANVKKSIIMTATSEYNKIIKSIAEGNLIMNEEYYIKCIKEKVLSKYAINQTENTIKVMEKYIDEVIQKLEAGKIVSKIDKKEETR